MVKKEPIKKLSMYVCKNVRNMLYDLIMLLYNQSKDKKMFLLTL